MTDLESPKSEFENSELESYPTPPMLRMVLMGLLVVGVIGAVGYGMIRTSAVSPAATLAGNGEECRDPVTENRLRETLAQSPNDFTTLMDWAAYNFSCEKNYPTAVAAYQQAANIAEQANSSIPDNARIEAQFRLGLSLLYNDNLPLAREQFQRVLAIDPNNTSALLAVSAIYRRESNNKEATTYLQKVLQLDPTGMAGKQAQALLDEINKR